MTKRKLKTKRLKRDKNVEYDKAIIVPTQEMIDAYKDFFQSRALPNGEIHFYYREAFENPLVAKQIKSENYFGMVMNYFATLGYVEKIQSGTRYQSSIWNVSKFLEQVDSIPDREQIGTFRLPKNYVHVEVVPEAKAEVAAPKAVEADQSEAITEINKTIQSMLGYLQTLPNEMGTHLNALSQKLEANGDPEVIASLQETIHHLTTDKKKLYDELEATKKQLREAEMHHGANVHRIYSQCNSIKDDVNRIINIEAWTLRTRGPKMAEEIYRKLDYITKELGVEESNEQLEIGGL